jgi:RNA polymerase sigma factor (sigma-70 family)
VQRGGETFGRGTVGSAELRRARRDFFLKLPGSLLPVDELSSTRAVLLSGRKPLTKPASTPILQGLRRLAEDSGPHRAPDQVLLHRLVAEQDAAAFDLVLRRHGPMVLGVCRSVLRNEADAEDAFQASFLVFARKAMSIRQTTSLASWLHGVAYRTALRAKADLAIRRKHEARVPPPQPESAEDLPWREVRHILHAELNALPAKYRGPMVLCYLQGKTQDEAADDLGLAKGTLKGRLEKGRAMLRKRLVRRGLGAAGLLIASTWPAALQAVDVVRPVLQVSTLDSAIALLAGNPLTGLVSAEILALTEGVVKAMFLSRLGVATVLTSGILLIAIAVALGIQAVSADPSAVSRAKTQSGGSTELPPGSKKEPGNKTAAGRETPWGKEAGGLSTRLVLVSGAKVGEPVTVRLEMKNVAQEERTYDRQQADVNGSLLVTGPDGKPVPYIDLSYQTAGGPQVLKPGETVTIFETLDVAAQYLLDQPGAYTIQFRGLRAHFGNNTAIPPSNVLSVTLERGTAPPFAAVYRRLQTVTPPEWKLSKSRKAFFLSRVPTSLKRDIVTVQLWFTKEKKSGYEDREKGPANLEYLGETTLGHAWMSADEKVNEHWPKYGTDLRAVVNEFRKDDASEKK